MQHKPGQTDNDKVELTPSIAQVRVFMHDEPVRYDFGNHLECEYRQVNNLALLRATWKRTVTWEWEPGPTTLEASWGRPKRAGQWRTAMKSAFHVPDGSIGDAHAMVHMFAPIVMAMSGSKSGASMMWMKIKRGALCGGRQRRDFP